MNPSIPGTLWDCCRVPRSGTGQLSKCVRSESISGGFCQSQDINKMNWVKRRPMSSASYLFLDLRFVESNRSLLSRGCSFFVLINLPSGPRG